MPNLSTQASSALSDRARRGDIEAGKELIKMCRQGGVRAYWEKDEPLTEEDVKRHLERRTIVGSGKGTM